VRSQQELLIEGAGYANCVTKIEAALQAFPGVTRAEMNFAQRTVTVTGNTQRQTLIRAIEKAGYNAKAVEANSDAAALEEKELAEPGLCGCGDGFFVHDGGTNANRLRLFKAQEH